MFASLTKFLDIIIFILGKYHVMAIFNVLFYTVVVSATKTRTINVLMYYGYGLRISDYDVTPDMFAHACINLRVVHLWLDNCAMFRPPVNTNNQYSFMEIPAGYSINHSFTIKKTDFRYTHKSLKNFS